jgi:hypothetical protein
MSPDIQDLNDLLEALRTRHAFVYYTFVFLSALGVLGIFCITGTFVGQGNR